jgi:glucan phosphoethanolaminetransferase (alkaline phosphatase superfamily)
VRLVGLGLFQLAVSAAAIALLVRGSDWAAQIALIHLGLVAALWLGCVFALGAIAQATQRRGTRVARALCGLLPFALFAALSVVYVADLVAVRNWSHTVSLVLLGQFLANLPNLARLMPLRAAVTLGLLAAAGIGYARGAAGIHAAATRLFARHAGLRFSALIAATAALAAVSAGKLARAPVLWSQEPFASLLDLQLPQAGVRASGSPPIGLAQYPVPQSIRRANVILLIVDAMRAANMGLYGYERATTPFLSGLYSRGELARVELGLSRCSQSDCGVLGVLGSTAAGHWRPGDLKLEDVLHALGYRVVFLLSDAHYEWHDYFGPNIDLIREDPTNDDTNLLRALRALPGSDRPTFLYLHLMATHWFGVQRREFQHWQPTAKRFDWLYDVKRALAPSGGGDLRQRVINRYDNSVLQADATLERLFDALSEKGYLDDAVVAIVADHGEALGERGESYYGHGVDLYQELIRVPILFHDTRDRAGFGALGFATLADVAPTLLGRIGAAVPPSWDGRSLLAGRPRRRSFHEAAIPAARSRSGRDERVRAVVERETDGATWKLMRFEQRDGAVERIVREELYELGSDPGERDNRIETADPARRAALEARLSAHFAGD